MSHLRRLEDAQPISDKSNISGYVTAIADSARILCEQSGKTLSIQNNISDIPIGIDYTLLWMGKTYLYSERSTVIYWDIYRNSLDIIQTLQLGISLCMLRH